MSETVNETPMKHIINIACTGPSQANDRAHPTKRVRLNSFGNWLGPWGGEAGDLDYDQPWHYLPHWIARDIGARTEFNANTSTEAVSVLYLEDQGVLAERARRIPGRARGMAHPTLAEVRAELRRLPPAPPRGPASEEELVAAMAWWKARVATFQRRPDDPRPFRIVYNLRCPLCHMHVPIPAEKLYPTLDGLTSHCEPVPEDVLERFTPPPGKVRASTLSLTQLAERVTKR